MLILCLIYINYIYCVPSRETCTCSMLTATLLLLYGKLIPLRFFPWCDNLVTLGLRWNLVFRCFSKVKKNRWVVRAFCVPSRQPLDQIGWNSESMLSERLSAKPVCKFWLCLFFAGSFIFFPFQTCKKITNARAKKLRHGFWGQCVKKQMPC